MALVCLLLKVSEHKGVPGRLLKLLGPLKQTGTRPEPRTDDLILVPQNHLTALRTELLSKVKNPTAFIQLVFCSVVDSDVQLWVEPSHGIIKSS